MTMSGLPRRGDNQHLQPEPQSRNEADGRDDAGTIPVIASPRTCHSIAGQFRDLARKVPNTAAHDFLPAPEASKGLSETAQPGNIVAVLGGLALFVLGADGGI
ncbi:MAG TPA: hypothetical protein VMU06_13395 [Stellaceae bacterium]|nr:hypothetical protein [Stellaceae bacterium]